MIGATSAAEFWTAVGSVVGGIGTLVLAAAAVGIVGSLAEVRRGRDEEKRAQLDREIKDVDETRQLLLVTKQDPAHLLANPFLAATIVNALAHHSHLASESFAVDALNRFARDNTGLDIIEGWIDALTAAGHSKALERDKLLEHASRKWWQLRRR